MRLELRIRIESASCGISFLKRESFFDRCHSGIRKSLKKTSSSKIWLLPGDAKILIRGLYSSKRISLQNSKAKLWWWWRIKCVCLCLPLSSLLNMLCAFTLLSVMSFSMNERTFEWIYQSCVCICVVCLLLSKIEIVNSEKSVYLWRSLCHNIESRFIFFFIRIARERACLVYFF